MHPSRYNYYLPTGTGEYLLLNPLSGCADLASPSEVERLKKLDPADGEAEYWVRRGYAVKAPEDEGRLLADRYREFLAAQEASPVQVHLVPTYGCELECVYCFQKEYPKEHRVIDEKTVDAFFAHLPGVLSLEREKPLLTLYGGEPLGGSRRQKEMVAYIIRKSASAGYPVAVVTNGYHLEEYLEILSGAEIREIHVTVDGPEEVHDARRPTRGGRGTFRRIMAGLAGAVKMGYPINLRIVTDSRNLPRLPELAEYLDERGWLDLPPELFKTQIGRNYELHSCSDDPSVLFDQARLWAEVTSLSRKEPILRRLHRPEFLGLRGLVDGGELPVPGFDLCPATKKEWVYDLNGDIYGCTATAGKKEYRLGTFYPEPHYDEAAIGEWRERSILTIPGCRECRHALFCGGGCGAVAARRSGTPLTPDCRPVEEVLAAGADYYGRELKDLALGG